MMNNKLTELSQNENNDKKSALRKFEFEMALAEQCIAEEGSISSKEIKQKLGILS